MVTREDWVAESIYYVCEELERSVEVSNKHVLLNRYKCLLCSRVFQSLDITPGTVLCCLVFLVALPLAKNRDVSKKGNRHETRDAGAHSADEAGSTAAFNGPFPMGECWL